MYSPEDQVTDLVGFPCMHERDVARDCRLHDEPPAIEEARLLRVPGDHDPRLDPPWVVPDGDAPRLDRRVGASGRVDARLARSVRVQTGNEGTLGNELDADIAVEIRRLEVLVPVTSHKISVCALNLSL